MLVLELVRAITLIAYQTITADYLRQSCLQESFPVPDQILSHVFELHRLLNNFIAVVEKAHVDIGTLFEVFLKKLWRNDVGIRNRELISSNITPLTIQIQQGDGGIQNFEMTSSYSNPNK